MIWKKPYSTSCVNILLVGCIIQTSSVLVLNNLPWSLLLRPARSLCCWWLFGLLWLGLLLWAGLLWVVWCVLWCFSWCLLWAWLCIAVTTPSNTIIKVVTVTRNKVFDFILACSNCSFGLLYQFNLYCCCSNDDFNLLYQILLLF